MKLRKIRISNNEMDLLMDYCKSLGYQLEGGDNLYVLKDLETQKRVFLQREHRHLITVSDEALLVDAKTMEMVETEIVENLNENLWIFKMLKHPKNHPVREGARTAFKFIQKQTMRDFLKEVVGIKSLEFSEIR